MANFTLSPAEIVSQLQRLLVESYTRDDGESSILKEIVQNADDAEAERLSFVLLRSGLPETTNSLLHGPLLACINDGAFTRKHELALTTIGGTSKAEQPAAVGRFGLGQKSVFHLAEAYFYLGRNAENDKILASVIDPWSNGDGDRQFPDWVQFNAEDLQRVQTALALWISGPKWFVLLLPLRLRRHKRARAGVISEHYPDLDALEATLGRISNIACLLPQIGCLRTIEAWTMEGVSGARRLGSASWPENTNRLSRCKEPARFQRTFTSVIRTADADGSREMKCFGVERSLYNGPFQDLPSHANWPRRVVSDEDTFSVREKAIGHGAVTILRGARAFENTTSAAVSMGWAVFLPLGPVVDPHGMWTLWLHGHFFLDSGRRRAVGFDEADRVSSDQQQQMRIRWNQLVRDEVTLRCLLPALKLAIDATDPQEAEALARAIAASPLWLQHRTSATRKASLVWGPVCDPKTGKVQSERRWIEGNARLLAVPRPSREISDDVQGIILAWMRAEAHSNVRIVWEDSPRLCCHSEWEPWTASDVEAVFQKGIAERLAKPAAVRLFTQWLSSIPESNVAVSQALVGLLREALAAGYRLRSREWQDVARRCPPDELLWTRAEAAELVAELARLPTRILVLPIALSPDATGMPLPSLSIDDAIAILRKLEPRIHQNDDVHAQRLAAEVVRALGPNKLLERTDLHNLSVFRVWSARRGMVCLDAARLIMLQRRHLAYVKSGMAQSELVARQLLNALDDLALDVILASEESIADTLKLPALSPANICEAVLAAVTTLAEPLQRRDLFRQLAKERMQADAAQAAHALHRGLRVLLHGFPSRSADLLPLFVAPNNNIIPRRVLHALLMAIGEDWRLLSDSFEETLSGAWRHTLGVEVLDIARLIERLRQAPDRWLTRLATTFDEHERAALRGGLAAADADDLFQALPIQETLDGYGVCVDAMVFLEGNWPVSELMRDKVQLVRVDPRPQVAAFQHKLIRLWSPDAHVQLLFDLCDADERGRSGVDILTALGAFARDPSTVPNEILQRLRSEPWVLMSNGTVARPEDILDIPLAIDRALHGLLDDQRRAYYTPSEIDVKARACPHFPSLEKLRLTSRGQDALSAAADQLREHARSWGGRYVLLRAQRRSEDEKLLSTALSLRQLRDDPATQLVRALLDKLGEHWFEHGREFIDAFRGTPSAERLIQLLDAVPNEQERRTEAGEILPEDAKEFFLDVLTVACQRSDFVTSILPHIRLLDGDEKWRPSGQLARRGENLQPRFRMDAKHEQLIVPLLPSAGATTMIPETSTGRSSAPTLNDYARAPSVLEEYLAPFRERLSSNAAGHFVALLGDGQGNQMRALAERLLNGLSLENAREKFLHVYNATALSTEQSKCRQAKWAVHVVDVNTPVQVESLLGTTIKATVARTGDLPRHLLLDHVADARQGGWIRLRRLDLSPFPIEKVSEVLRKTMVEFLMDSLGIGITNDFNTYWDQMVRSGRAQVDAIRKMILSGLPDRIEEIVGSSDERLRNLVRRVWQTEQRLNEVQQDNRLDEPKKIAQDERDKAQKELQHAVENDRNVQATLVQAICHKINDQYQYSTEQVLFELLQNADDAAAQLLEMVGPGNQTAMERARRFEVSATAHDYRLVVRHFGREINQHEADHPFPEGRNRGYDRDLHRMMLLHRSDKDDKNTGRFGLGFKSIYLVTDRPRLRSGPLSFEIVAGFLPRHYPSDGTEAGTAITLPARSPEVFEAALRRFRKVGGLCAVFPQMVRHVELLGDFNASSTWSPLRVDGLEEVEVGTVHLTLDGQCEATRLLVIRGGSGTPQPCIAFAIGPHKIRAIDTSVPTIWCTAPTLETWGIGYCMNGPFSLDVGRGQLAREANKNQHAFRQIGVALGQALIKLCKLLEERFEETADFLGLERTRHDDEEVRLEFWRSLFERLTALDVNSMRGPVDDTHNTRQLLSWMHTDGLGLSALLRIRRVLPTGLPSEHNLLTKLSDVKYVLDEVVSDPQVFKRLQRFPWFVRNVPPGAAVSQRIWSGLEALELVAHTEEKLLGFEKVLSRILPEKCALSHNDALLLSGLEKEMQRFFNSDAINSLRKQAATWQFKSRKGTPQPARDLLLGKAFEALVEKYDSDRELEDEIKRASFAPEEHVLADDYAQDAQMLEWFLFVRRSLEAKAEKLAVWAALAATTPLRIAVIDYLARGRLGREVASAIRKREGKLWWCSTATQLDDFARHAGLSTREINELRVMLLDAEATISAAIVATDEELLDENEDETLEGDTAASWEDDCDEILEKLADWWDRRGAHWIQRYEAETYPKNWQREKFTNELAQGDRQAWMLLFILGVCRRFGRQTPEQHRGFIQTMKEFGSPIHFWTIFADPPRPDDAKRWMGILDQWLKSISYEDEYRRWLEMFPTLYQVHCYEHVYRDLLLKAPRRDPREFSLTQLLAPRTDPKQGQGGVDAPPAPLAFGIGTVWIFRELVRFGVISAPFFDKHGFVPRSRVRTFLLRLGANDLNEKARPAHIADWSKTIYDFLSKHLDGPRVTFNNAFDMPMYLVETDSNARAESGLAPYFLKVLP